LHKTAANHSGVATLQAIKSKFLTVTISAGVLAAADAKGRMAEPGVIQAMA